MKVLRAELYPSVCWRNGGGTTREIAIHCVPRQRDDFLWRISLATVSRSGPFSRFDGVDRTIALVDGEGMLLHTPTNSMRVTGDTPTFSFDGETEINCQLLGGSTIDLNVMTRRGFFRHTLRREPVLGWTTIKATADQTFVVSNGFFEVSWRGRGSLLPLDTVGEIPSGTAFDLFSDIASEIFIVEITRS